MLLPYAVLSIEPIVEATPLPTVAGGNVGFV